MYKLNAVKRVQRVIFTFCVRLGGGKHTLISFFKALWWPGFICKFLASQTYDFNQIFSVGRENIVLQAHIIS